MEKYFGKNLKNLRLEHGLTQPQLGQIVGVTPECISQYESSVRKPNVFIAAHIAETLDVTVDAMLNTPPDDLLAEQIERRKNG